MAALTVGLKKWSLNYLFIESAEKSDAEAQSDQRKNLFASPPLCVFQETRLLAFKRGG
jgi:hypothetical protein